MRVKRGFAGKRRHKRIMKQAKGFRGRRKNCFKFAKDAVDRSLAFAYRDRRTKKRDFRRLWITRISAAARLSGLSYSKLIHGMGKADIQINRKVLSELAIRDPQGFAQIAEKARAALAA